MIPKKRLLVAPLNWGLGHATRCIPIIDRLLKKDCEVLIASDGDSLKFLHEHYPSLSFFELPGYSVQYAQKQDSMVLKMLEQLPKFAKAINEEHNTLQEIIEREHLDIVIADNRYGCYSKKIKSIFITHQLNILMPEKWRWMERYVNQFNHGQIKKFSECWIPAPDSSLIPELVKSPKSIHRKYIGYLSRFETKKTGKKNYDIVAVVSGPSPQREEFVKIAEDQFRKSNLRTLIVKGDPKGSSLIQTNGNNSSVDYLLKDELNDIIKQAEIIIARSGYSMIMDLIKLNKKAIFVPTPGQTEQEYIAQELMNRKIAWSVSQSSFDLKSALVESGHYSGFNAADYDDTLLEKAIDSIL